MSARSFRGPAGWLSFSQARSSGTRTPSNTWNSPDRQPDRCFLSLLHWTFYRETAERWSYLRSTELQSTRSKCKLKYIKRRSVSVCLTSFLNKRNNLRAHFYTLQNEGDMNPSEVLKSLNFGQIQYLTSKIIRICPPPVNALEAHKEGRRGNVLASTNIFFEKLYL